jgi:hypothetical protein
MLASVDNHEIIDEFRLDAILPRWTKRVLIEEGGREIVDQRSRPNNLGVIQRHSLSSARQYASVDAMTVIQ